MAQDPCLDAIKDARFALSDEEARDLIKKLRDEKKHLMKASPGDWQVKFRKKMIKESENASLLPNRRNWQ